MSDDRVTEYEIVLACGDGTCPDGPYCAEHGDLVPDDLRRSRREDVA